MSSTALAAFVAMNSRSCDMLSLTKMSDLPNTGRPPLFDFSASRNARARAKRLGGDRFLYRAAVEGVADRLQAVTRKFEHGLLIGEAVPDEIAAFAQNWLCADFDAKEILTVPASFDLAVSLFSLQAINDLPGALVQIRRALKPDGLFLGAILGGSSLSELRAAFAQAEIVTRGGVSPRVSPFADVRDLGGLLQRGGFALPVADVERLTVRYRDLSGLARDLRVHGLTNFLSERSKHSLRRDTLASLVTHYASQHGEDGKLLARFETVYLTGWAPHESQQVPLKPGSAQTRLADALGTDEHRLRRE